MSKRRIKGLKAKVGRKCCIGRRGADGPVSTVKIHKLEESEEEITVLVDVGSPEESGTQQEGQLQE